MRYSKILFHIMLLILVTSCAPQSLINSTRFAVDQVDFSNYKYGIVAFRLTARKPTLVHPIPCSIQLYEVLDGSGKIVQTLEQSNNTCLLVAFPEPILLDSAGRLFGIQSVPNIRNASYIIRFHYELNNVEYYDYFTVKGP